MMVLVFFGITIASLQSPFTTWQNVQQKQERRTLLDRNGKVLMVRYPGTLNYDTPTPLYQIPSLLKTAFVQSEDQRFFTHGGVDWQARLSAAWQNIRHGERVRGASTITEQVVRMLHPRPRNIWSKWLEGIEAAWLERTISKADILEFYLNNIPYTANRRGVVQAARYYFDRDLGTLDTGEMLALVVMARAPSAYDLYRHPKRIDRLIGQLASTLKHNAKLAPEAKVSTDFKLQNAPSSIFVQHFASALKQENINADQRNITTTIDAGLQQKVQSLLDARIAALRLRNVQNGAALVVDHQTGEVLAWAVAGATKRDTPGGDIDAVSVPRQPGSAMKPFLYALAFEKSMTASTLLNDAPLTEAIGAGLHRFRNYSGQNYGPITAREALGNSLNIPALLTIRRVGTAPYLDFLHDLGFTTLTRGSAVYDEGLALGIGEVSLYEMVQAYAVLAEKGRYQPLHSILRQTGQRERRIVTSPETASLISDILSDPWARRLEFGQDSILNLSTRTAVKTGTSNDYHDAWVFGYNDRYVVGIWMGNLNRQPMENVTGSTGPALVMRSIFNELNRNRTTRKLYFSPKLAARDVCIRPPVPDGSCPIRTEWFAPATLAADQIETKPPSTFVELVRPTQNLQIAYDPRIPASHQMFRFELKGLDALENLSVRWILNGQDLATTTTPRYQWPVKRGNYSLAVAISAKGFAKKLAPVSFRVK